MKIPIHKLKAKDFQRCRRFVVENNLAKSVDKVAFSLLSRRNGPMIVLNENVINTINSDYRSIIIAHESAHCNGIKDEESADRKALEYLNEKQQEMLKSMWKIRHGHKYETITTLNPK